MSTSFLQNWQRLLAATFPAARRRKRQTGLCVETLESRCVPSVFLYKGRGTTDSWTEPRNWFCATITNNHTWPSDGDQVIFNKTPTPNDNRRTDGTKPWEVTVKSVTPKLVSLEILAAWQGVIDLGGGLVVTTGHFLN
jgi:hypothetical protein